MPDVVNGYKWELYNIADDFSENNDLAAKMPDKLRDLQELFLVEAAKYNVFPLDNSILHAASRRDPARPPGGPSSPTRAKCPACPYGDAPNILTKSYTITAEVEIPKGGAEGMLVTMGGRFGGYGLYLLKGKPVFTYNFLGLERFRWEGKDALTPGKHTIVFDFKYDGPGFGKGGTGVLSVDGKEVASKKIPHTIPSLMTIDESFDVGRGYPHAGGRQRLSAAVPVHRQARQADDQANSAGEDSRRGQPPQTKDSGGHKRSAVIPRRSRRIGVGKSASH